MVRNLKIGFRRILGVLVLAVPVFSAGVLAQDAAQCEAGLHLFSHAMGETCIPENPQRVVVLDTGELDNALALGASIIGAPISESQQYQAYLDGQLDGIEDTGKISEPNLEVILSLAPDLILGSKQRHEAVYEQLSQIAPTVLTTSLRVPWQENFAVHAAALGKTAEAELLLADYAARAAEIRNGLGDDLENMTFSIIRFRPGQVRLYLKSSYIGYILQDVGLQRPESQNVDSFSAEISMEEMQQVDADYVFVTGYDVEESERETFLGSPLWQTLDAVKNERVIDVNDDTWIAGLGVQAAQLVLEDLYNLLVAPEAELACAAGFRLFDHPLLATEPVCVPENPQRVVAIDAYSLETALALGITPLGSSAVAPFSVQYPELLDIVSGITDTGSPVNLEILLSLEPDLIITIEPWIADIYSEISEIAPVISISFDDLPWEGLLDIVAGAVNQADSVESYIDAYNARIETLTERIAADGLEGTVSIVQFSNNVLRVYPVEASYPYLFPVIGLYGSAEQTEAIGDNWRMDLSKEQIGLLDTDHLFMAFYAANAESVAENEAMLTTLEADPLWQVLGVVKAGHVYPVPFYWNAGGIIAQHKILDDLFTHVVGVAPADISPNPVLP